MKIGIDARFWSQTGVGRYIREIVGGISKLDKNNQYVVFLTADDVEKVHLPDNFKKVKTTIRWHTLAEQINLPLLYVREHLDLLFIPNFNVPIFYPGKFVTTIHDLTLLRTRTGQATKLPYLIYTAKYLASVLVHIIAVARAEKIFTVSNYVKTDLVRTFRINPNKVVLTPNAVDKHFYRRTETEVSEVLKKYNLVRPYLFYVGNGCPHKNLWKLAQAFEVLSKDVPGISLVLGGKQDFTYLNLAKQCSTLRSADKIKFVGFIDDEDLPAIYSGAEAYISPSLYEGFGIQILEAFACGCKAVCSNTTSLPEVGGEWASYFDPYDVKDMAEVIKLSISRNILDFNQKALQHTQNYSWDTSAKSVLQVLTTV